jgi:hypothetical protein
VNEARLGDDHRASINLFVAAAQSLRPAEMHRVLAFGAVALGPARCLDTIVMPAVRQIVQLTDEDPASLVVVSLAVETARAWVDGLTASAPVPAKHRPIVLACGPGDRHSLGLEALTMLLRQRAEPCRLLAGAASAGRVLTAVEVNRPTLVVLVTQRSSGHHTTIELLRSLEGSGTKAFYAGAAFEPVASRHDVPGIYLGTSFERALTMITRTLVVELAATPRWSE